MYFNTKKLAAINDYMQKKSLKIKKRKTCNRLNNSRDCERCCCCYYWVFAAAAMFSDHID